MSAYYTLLIAAFCFFLGVGIGRRWPRARPTECSIAPDFTTLLCEKLGFPHPVRTPDESDRQYLIRRLSVIQCISRKWSQRSHTALARLSDDGLHVAGSQICDEVADYLQDYAVHQYVRACYLERAAAPVQQEMDNIRERHAPDRRSLH